MIVIQVSCVRFILSELGVVQLQQELAMLPLQFAIQEERNEDTHVYKGIPTVHCTELDFNNTNTQIYEKGHSQYNIQHNVK